MTKTKIRVVVIEAYLSRKLASELGATYLNVVLLHRQRSINVVQLVVQTAGIAYRLPDLVASPERCVHRVTVGTLQSDTSR